MKQSAESILEVPSPVSIDSEFMGENDFSLTNWLCRQKIRGQIFIGNTIK